MPDENRMSKAYDPNHVEQRLYQWWESRGYFTPKIDWNQKPFVIVIPPPNVTGELHHGHAMFVTFEDLLIRWHRMQGEPTLWLPGADHAGIATQNVVEKALTKGGTTRQQLGREEFVRRVWEWKEEYGGIITNQIRRLGASVDWTRERFTLDAGLSRAVREAFVRLYEKDLIYRGPRLVNWCPRCETAISDLEVEHEETQGELYYIKYPIEGEKDKFITVATTRPETMLGDTAIAVHPRDRRYKKLVGRIAILPELLRPIPIIADEAVDRKFGTGAVKVTPGHDQTDYDIGQRHNLPIVNIMNRDATINANGGPYAGLDRFAARELLVKDLERDGLLAKIEPHTLSIGHCQRCGTIVEPLISTQWFVKTRPLAEAASAAVKNGETKIVPKRFEKTYFQWMDNIRDWCISRQLWWGHRIPVWYCENEHMTCAREDPTACAVCGSTNLRQDEDVLDTWFSSALWPFSTLGWPDDTEDLRYFYPTSVLETGYDIIFFWVARMMMAGCEFTGKAPFHTVYLHGLMRHQDGSKMSKSDFRPGDNPLDVIADYSADALRFFIVTSSSPGNDVRMNLDKVEEARNFANKLWNAARFVAGNLGEEAIEPEVWKSRRLSMADRWILSRHNAVIAKVTRLLKDFRFNDAGQELYHFFWDEFCDWYLEASKVTLYGDDEDAKQRTRALLLHVLDRSLRLLHPMMPFVTEEIYQHLRRPDWPEALIIAPWPNAGKTDAHVEREFSVMIDIVRAIRNARNEHAIEPGRRIPAIIDAGAHAKSFRAQRSVLANLARLEPKALRIEAEIPTAPAKALALHVGTATVYLPLASILDVERERARLRGEIEQSRAGILRSENLLAGDFAKKAPAEVVQRERDRLGASLQKLEQLETRMAQLHNLASDSASSTPDRAGQEASLEEETITAAEIMAPPEAALSETAPLKGPADFVTWAGQGEAAPPEDELPSESVGTAEPEQPAEPARPAQTVIAEEIVEKKPPAAKQAAAPSASQEAVEVTEFFEVFDLSMPTALPAPKPPAAALPEPQTKSTPIPLPARLGLAHAELVESALETVVVVEWPETEASSRPKQSTPRAAPSSIRSRQSTGRKAGRKKTAAKKVGTKRAVKKIASPKRASKRAVARPPVKKQAPQKSAAKVAAPKKGNIKKPAPGKPARKSTSKTVKSARSPRGRVTGGKKARR